MRHHVASSSAALLTAAASLLAVSSPASVSAALVEQWWNIGWVPNQIPDGLAERSVIGVNGTWPPPVIMVKETDTLRIHATNSLETGVGTALHSHGMFFNQTTFYDGAVGVTQCPIPPGQSFTYEPLNSPLSPEGRHRQWGTFWTHGHYKGQYVDGLRTPFIIHPDNAADMHHSYDDDFTLILSDWYHRNHTDLLFNEFLNRKNPTGAEPVPDSGLIYFAHTSNTSIQADGTAPILPGYNENATLSLTPGKTYRLRLINMSALSMYHIWLDGHDMRIIEVDGQDVEEYPVDELPISVAQRYSILFTARNDTSTNFHLHANLDPNMYDVVPDALNLNLTATLSYADGNPVAEDKIWLEEEYPYFDDTQLVPSIPETMFGADVSHDLMVNFNTRADGQNYAEFNNITYVGPMTPSVFTALSMTNESNNAAIYGPATNTHILEHMQDVELIVYNFDAGTHPFHLHGHAFQVVHKTRDVTSTDPEINPPFNSSQINPMKRDTITIPTGGAATLRFRADNPGAWFFHCHIEWHLESGLAAIFMSAPEMLPSLLRTPAYIGEQCAALGISTSGNAGGIFSTTNFGTLPKETPYLSTGWTSKAAGTFAGCAITALLGVITVCVYGFGDSSEEDEDEKAQ